MANLRFKTGPGARESVELLKVKTSFGRRRSSDCVLEHKTVSRDHFHIELISGKYFLVDDESGNGTFVNGERVTWIELKHDDVVQVGPFELAVDLSDVPQTADAHHGGSGERQYVAFNREHEAAYPSQFIEGIRYFNQRNYYDAHEVWEEIWLHSSGEEKLFYQMLIQSAVGLHHFERGNARGARGMYNAAAEKLKQLPCEFMSIDLELFSRQLRESLKAVLDNSTEANPDQMPMPLITLLPLQGGKAANM